MNLITSVFIFIITILIKIGDGVLFVIQPAITLPGKIIKKIFAYHLFKNTKKQRVIFQRQKTNRLSQTSFRISFSPQKKIQEFFQTITQFIKKDFLDLVSAVKHVGSMFKRRKKRHDPHIRQAKKTNRIVTYSVSFLTRISYFLAGTVFSFLFIFIPLLFLVFLQDLPNPNELILQQIPQTTKIYDRNKTLLFEIYSSQNRTLVPLDAIPSTLKEATIAIEDKDFYKHPGFDITAIARSAIEDLSGKPLQGGSTLTQQLVKSSLLSPETSLSRKIKEIILAFWAERIYSKNQILQMYLNQVPYGGTAWGTEAASQTYFGKSVKDLDLAESAFLAGIPRAPTIYSPYGSTPNAWRKRQKDVLERMQNLGYITKDQKNQALSENLQFLPQQTPILAPHFVMYVKDLLTQKYGISAVEHGGLTVITSLDLQTQNMAQKIVSDEVGADGYLNLSNGASLVTNPSNGDILAMVGSKDYHDLNGGAVNVTTSLRQPGSSIKLVTYTAAMSQGLTAATILDDSPVTYSFPGSPSYSPVNYDGRFHGRVPLRIAFANSFNIPAVKTLNQIGIPAFLEYGKKMGITTWNTPKRYGLSITLGGAEVKMVDMATLYGVMANQGKRVDLNPILKVSDYKGNVLEQKPNVTDGEQVVDPGVTYIISSILSDNNARSLEFGPNSPLNIPNHTVPVKTGTTDSKRDNWTLGYTSNRLVAVWVGNNDNTPMSPNLASGITGAAPIWNKIMSNLLQTTPETSWQQPDDLVTKSCLGRSEYFVRGTENSVNCAPLPSISPPITKPPSATSGH